MSEHFDRVTILEFIEGEAGARHEEIAAHLAACALCRDAFDDLQQLVALLEDGSVFDFLDDLSMEADRTAIQRDLVAAAERDEEGEIAAEAFFSDLVRRPVGRWQEAVASNPKQNTGGLVRRLLLEVTTELDREPERALAILEVAELVAYALIDDACRSALGDVWKQRANAFRQLARYAEAVDAAWVAEGLYASVRTGTFDVGQAQYARAVTLFKMTRYADALEVLAVSRATLQDFGNTAPLAKTMMLEAAIRYERGESASAARLWRELVPILQLLDQRLELARVWANLAACDLRLGLLDQATAEAHAALKAYRALGGNKAEEVRVAWTIAMIDLTRDSEDGLDQLYDAAAGFESLGMVGDAAFVKLDIAEELLHRQSWEEVEVIARELVVLFKKAGVTMASVSAVDFLRQAVEQRHATTETVRYIREFVTADDPQRPFVPPAMHLT